MLKDVPSFPRAILILILGYALLLTLGAFCATSSDAQGSISEITSGGDWWIVFGIKLELVNSMAASFIPVLTLLSSPGPRI